MFKVNKLFLVFCVVSSILTNQLIAMDINNEGQQIINEHSRRARAYFFEDMLSSIRQTEREREAQEFNQYVVPSLQCLILKFIQRKNIEGNNQLFDDFKRKYVGVKSKSLEKDVTCEVIQIALIQLLRNLSDRRLSPLDQFKITNPIFEFLLDNNLVDFHLSIRQLIRSGAVIECDGESLFLTCLSLTSLDGIKSIENITKVQKLYLDDNLLISIDPGVFGDLPQLLILRLNGNKIYRLNSNTFKGLSQLQELSLYDNQIVEIQPNAFEDLSVLKLLLLKKNKISKIESGIFNGLFQLNSLSISDNKINKIEDGSFKGLLKLKDLTLSVNKIDYIKPGIFEDLSELQLLSLRSNKLTVIQPDAFKGLFKLISLHLYNNQIVNLDTEIFSNLSHLTELLLSNNQLTPELQRQIATKFTRIVNLDLTNQRTLDNDDESSEEEHDVVADAVVGAIDLGVRGVQRLRDAAPEECTIS